MDAWGRLLWRCDIKLVPDGWVGGSPPKSVEKFPERGHRTCEGAKAWKQLAQPRNQKESYVAPASKSWESIWGEEAGILTGPKHSGLCPRRAWEHFTPPHFHCRARHLVQNRIQQVPEGAILPSEMPLSLPIPPLQKSKSPVGSPSWNPQRWLTTILVMETEVKTGAAARATVTSLTNATDDPGDRCNYHMILGD